MVSRMKFFLIFIIAQLDIDESSSANSKENEWCGSSLRIGKQADISV